MKQRWVVVVEDTNGFGRQAYGPYASFKRAEGDAQAVNGHPFEAYVLLLQSLADEQMKGAKP